MLKSSFPKLVRRQLMPKGAIRLARSNYGSKDKLIPTKQEIKLGMTDRIGVR
jgi:hypothetical protein